ncbi:hypothetical protein [uncultured Rothia sp.]|uniref:hypothetical protein n=1 Tax=uncultured Rothia sp. TaxID=316088 RepID=UPI00288992F5|nr:hypothetical protein [uncultured Rothia sp.]
MSPISHTITSETLEWKGIILPIADVVVTHEFSPLPKDVSPGKRTPLTVTCTARKKASPTYMMQTPFEGGIPEHGDAVTMTLFKRYGDDGSTQSHQMNLVVDEIEYDGDNLSLRLIQRVDSFTIPISISPCPPHHTRYWAVRSDRPTKEQIGDVGETRSVNPSLRWPLYYALRAGGYSVTPPPLPTIELDLPLQGAYTPNTWDNPYYSQDADRDAAILSDVKAIDFFQNPGWYGSASKEPEGVSGIGFSGELARSRSNKDGASSPSAATFNGVWFMTEGIAQVTQAKGRRDTEGKPYRRGHTFTSFMIIRSEDAVKNPENLYQVKFCTSARRGLALRWNQDGHFWVYRSSYAQEWVGFSPSSESVVKEFDIDGWRGRREIPVVIEQIADQVIIRVGTIHEVKFNTPSVTASYGSTPTWVEVWIHNPPGSAAMGVTGVQVAGIPLDEPYKSRFMEVAKDYHRFTPKARIFSNPILYTQGVLPSVRAKPAGEVLDDICSSAGLTWWIRPDGVAVVVPLEDLERSSYGSTYAINVSSDVKDISISKSAVDAKSSLEVEYAAVAMCSFEEARWVLYEGGGYADIGKPIEVMLTADEEIDWLEPDFTVEDMATQGYRWLKSGVGSFYGGGTEYQMHWHNPQGVLQDGPKTSVAMDSEFELTKITPWSVRLTSKYTTPGRLPDPGGGRFWQRVNEGALQAVPNQEYRPREIRVGTPTHIEADIHGLPIIRARGQLKRSKKTGTIAGSVQNAGVLQVGSWDWLMGSSFAKAAGYAIAPWVLKPRLQIKSLVIRYRPEVSIGDTVNIYGTYGSEMGRAFNGTLTGIVYSVTHSPSVGETSLGVMVKPQK